MQSHHILSLQENTLGGKDYIIGDIHGDAASFTEVIGQLSPNDRLFMVGDLTDRGLQSADIIPLIMMYQRLHPNRLFIACGNHEQSCLRTIKYLEDRIDEFCEIPYTPDKTGALDVWLNDIRTSTSNNQQTINFKNHLKDGGEWLVRLYKQELYNGDITVMVPEEDSSDEFSSDEDDSEIIYESTSKIQSIKVFINALPYIIYVDGKHPFTISHADIPFDHQTLINRIAQGTGLTESEIRYVLNARASNPDGQSRLVIRRDHRNPNSIISYNGHNIILYGKAAVVRYETNAVNIDVASYKTGVALRVNHSDATCEYVGMNKDKALLQYPKLIEIQNELATHLHKVMRNQVAFMREHRSENVSSPMKPAVVAKLKKVVEPLSPSKRIECSPNRKRERTDQGDVTDQKATPSSFASVVADSTSPRKNGMRLFADVGSPSKRALFSEEAMIDKGSPRIGAGVSRH